MKKIAYYLGLMLIIVVFLPMVVVRGCSSAYKSPGKEYVPTPGEFGEEIKIRVYVADEGKVEEMLLESYVEGVVAAEMPVEFSMEALKAQAVAARTYALGRLKKLYIPKENPHPDADICTDSTHCQAWVSKQNALKKWGTLYGTNNWNKIEKAVEETKNIVLTYNGQIINPLFHSNGGGKTENSEEVWEGTKVPYLRSVASPGDEISSEFETSVTMSVKNFINTLKSKFPDLKISEKNITKNIKVLSKTTGGRINVIKIGNISVKGTDFRAVFNLRSANFSIKESGKTDLIITTIGNGHGVGMSQWGANYLAQNGGSFDEILKYYYTGVKLGRIVTK